MAIYFMDGKTFLKEFVKEEDPELIMQTQFIIVSASIRKSKKYQDQVIIANKYLYPHQNLIVDYDDYKHNEDYINFYKEYLNESSWFFAKIISLTIQLGLTVVFLTSYTEKKYYWFPIMQQYVESVFGYHIYDYKKVIAGKEHEYEYDPEDVLKVCKQILLRAEDDKFKRIMSNDKLREQYKHTCSKKELLKKLKKLGLKEGFEDASKDEILDALSLYYS